jgi:hypothetical protein
MRLTRPRPLLLATLALACVLGAPARALDHVFENLVYRGAGADDPEVRIPRIEFRDVDASAEDLRRMLDAQTPIEEAVAIATRLRAGAIVIPQTRIVFRGEDSGELVLGAGVIEKLAQARFVKFSIAGAQGRIVVRSAGEGEVVSGPLVMTDGDFSKLVEAARKGVVADGVARLGGFSWSGVRLSVPDKDVSATAVGGNLWRLGLASLTGATSYVGDAPAKMTGKMEGLVIAPPPASDAGRELAGFGLEKIDLGFALDAQYDAASKIFTLNDYALTGAGAGSLRLSGAFGSVEPALFTGDQATRLAAALSGDVRALNLRYVDDGLFLKSVAFFAARTGKTPGSVRSEWAMLVGGFVPILTGGDPAGFRIAEAASAFIREPRSVSVSMKGKAGPLRFLDLANINDPASFFAKVDLTVSANK